MELLFTAQFINSRKAWTCFLSYAVSHMQVETIGCKILVAKACEIISVPNHCGNYLWLCIDCTVYTWDNLTFTDASLLSTDPDNCLLLL